MRNIRTQLYLTYVAYLSFASAGTLLAKAQPTWLPADPRSFSPQPEHAPHTTNESHGTIDTDVPQDALVEEIDLHGAAPLLDRQIRRQLSVLPGDALSQEQLEAQIHRLKDFYERQGFFGTTIRYHAHWDAYNSGALVDYYINRGKSFRWGRLNVGGNALLPIGRIRSIFSEWGYYSPRSVREGIKQLATLCHSKGYPKARVQVVRLDPDFAHWRMNMALLITPGPKFEARFEGNQQLNTADLETYLTFIDDARVDSYAIEQSVAQVTQRYIDRGFLDARVTAEHTLASEDRDIVTFHISEGPRRTIWGVHFTGNRERSHGTLLTKILTQPLGFMERGTLNPKVLEEDRHAIVEYYQQEGFLDAHVDTPTVTSMNHDRSMLVTIPVVEGKMHRVGAVQFVGSNADDYDGLMERLSLKAGAPLNQGHLATDLQSVRIYFEDHGYPYADVTQLVTDDPELHRPNIVYHITPGPQVHIGTISVQGDFLTSQRAIFQALHIQEGDLYSDRAITESQMNLRRLGVFRSVAFDRAGLQTHRTVVDIAIRLEEERPFTVDIDAGYSTDTKFTGAMSFVNSNSFGWAKRTQFLLLGGERRARAEISWIDPRLLRTDLLLIGKTWIDRNKDVAFDVAQVGGSLGVYRQYHRTGFVVRYQLVRNRLLGGDPALADQEARRGTIMSQFTAGLTFDTRNNYSNPSRGIYAFAEGDVFNELKGARADFVRVRGGVTHYYDIWHNLIFNQTARIGGIQTIGAANIPITERFFLGGDDTIRGFSEDRVGTLDTNGDPLGGKVRWIYNADLSLPLFWGLRGATFFDIGSLTNSFPEINNETIRTSAGFGLRYVTPIGPLRAEWAWKLDRRDGEAAGRLHFTFGHIF